MSLFDARFAEAEALGVLLERIDHVLEVDARGIRPGTSVLDSLRRAREAYAASSIALGAAEREQRRAIEGPGR